MNQLNNNPSWIFPLVNSKKPNFFEDLNHPGNFGVVRKFDVHLYCEEQEEVIACEDGEVVLIENFTEKNATPPSPWWNETQAVLVEGESGVLVYGEIIPDKDLKLGQKIKAGEKIGNVKTVLKKDKGTPINMLHFEWYTLGTRETVIWEKGKQKPVNLLNPDFILINSKYKN